MTDKAYIVFYKQWTEEGDNRCGWSGYRDYVKFFPSVIAYQEWMDSTDHMRQACYKGREMKLEKIELYNYDKSLDVAFENANSAMRVDKKARAEKKVKLLKEREELDKQISEL
jgi:hypothetical protein